MRWYPKASPAPLMSMSQNKPLCVEPFFDPQTSTFSYVAWDATSLQAAIIDSVLDFDLHAGRIFYDHANAIKDFVRNHGLKVVWILETHIHADHLSAAPYLQQHLGGRIAIGRYITDVQKHFAKLFNLGPEFNCDGQQFDLLLNDGDQLALGQIAIEAMHTPGHTPACMTYHFKIDNLNAAFVGDTLFMPDFGTARCDFPGGSAEQLFSSVQKIFSLPGDTTLYMCHDYPPAHRKPSYRSTVVEQRRRNIHVHDGISLHDFVSMRKARDASLSMPALMFPSVQVNMRAGALPPAEGNGLRYLKIPLNAF